LARSDAQLDGWVLRDLLHQHREFLVRSSVKDGKPIDAARRELAALDRFLSLLDGVEIVGSYGPGYTDAYVTVRFAGTRR